MFLWIPITLVVCLYVQTAICAEGKPDKLDAALKVAQIAADAAKAGEAIAKKYHDDVKTAPKELMDAAKLEEAAVKSMLSGTKPGSKEILLSSGQGFGAGGGFQPPGFKISSKMSESTSSKRSEPSEQSNADAPVSYPFGVGPMLYGGCQSDSYSKTSPCFNSVQHFLQKGQCNNQLDAGNFIGVGFDGRGLYSSESRKTSLVQRKCTAGSYFLNSQVPDVMNCYGIYDTNVETKTFQSTADYMSYVRQKAGVSDTKSMFKAEAQKMSSSSSWGFDLGAIGAIAGGIVGAKMGGPEGAMKGAEAGAALGSMFGGGSGSGSGSQSAKENGNAKSAYEQRQESSSTSGSSSEMFAMMSVNIVLFEISLDEVTPNDISFAFLTDYASLPSSYLSSGAQAKYQDFLLRWGTHFVRSAKMGGKLRITKTAKKDRSMTSTEFAKVAESEFQAMFSNLQSSWAQKSSGFKILGFGKEDKSASQNQNYQKDSSSNANTNAANRLKQAMTQSAFTHTKVEAQGGDPQIASAVLDFYTPSFKDTFSAWLKSIFDYPKPIEFTLKGIDTLLNMNMDALFPNGEKNFGCSGSNANTIHTDSVTKRRFYYTDVVKTIGNESITEKAVVYCKYASLEDFKESFRRKHLALEKAIAVYLAEGPFPSSSFDIKGGKPGCETDTLSSYTGTQANPSWADMKVHKWNIIFDMPIDVPNVARKNGEYTVTYMYGKWFATLPGKEVIHLYEGCAIFHDDTNNHKLCINNLIMSYDEKSGLLTVTPDDYKKSNITTPGLPLFLNGATIAKAQVISLIELAKSKKLQGKALAVPCSVQWRNALRIDPTNRETCIHFSAATTGHIYVIFSSIPKETSSWYYIYITFHGVAYYKGMHLQKSDYGMGLGTLGDANLFASYFVCLVKYPNHQIGFQYGKADPDSSVGKVHSAFNFPATDAEESISFYTFGAGTDDISFHDVRVVKKLPTLTCPSNGYILLNGKCEINCDAQCDGCKLPQNNKECLACKYVRFMDLNTNGLTCLEHCPPGYHKDAKDLKLCTKCPVGQYKAESGPADCSPCKAGTYANLEGQSNCPLCPIGQYQPEPGKASCILASEGYYVDRTGSTNQIKCPIPAKPSTLLQKGSTASSDCHESVQLEGCFVDVSTSRAMHNIITQEKLTPQTCFKYCKELKADFFGLQEGKYCSCDYATLVDKQRQFGLYGTVDSKECGTKCSGDDSLTCGGVNRNQVYSMRSPSVTYEIGCFGDAHSRAMPLGPTELTGLTKKMCFSRCHEKGYEFFGLQGYKYCSCDDSETYNKYGKVADSECEYKCDGDLTHICGGNMKNRVYGIRKNLYRYLGCYQDRGERDLRLLFQTNTASIQFCHNYCEERKYEFFGLQGAGWCSCGNTAGAHGKLDDSKCNNDCTGNKAQKCGGDMINSVYAILSSKSMMIGCYKDNSANRDMADFENLGTRLTIDNCRKHCQDREKKFFAVQEGKYCACGNKYGRLAEHARAPIADCYKVACGGNVNEYCGGVNKNLVYMITR